MEIVETADREKNPIDARHQSAASKAHPRPDLRHPGRLLRALDVAGGELRVHLRRIDDGHDSGRYAAAERDQNRCHEIILNLRRRAECPRLRAAVRTDGHSIGPAGAALRAEHYGCTPSGYSANLPFV